MALVSPRPAGGGSGGLVSPGGGGTASVINQFNQASARADEARKIQQQQLLDAISNLTAQVGGTFDQAQAALVGLGESARTRADRRGERTLAGGQQDLISSGLFNTTGAVNLRRDVSEDVGLEQAGIDEGVRAQIAGLLGQKAGSQLQIGNLLTNAIQGQNIVGPDLSLFANLLSQSQGSNAPISTSIGGSTAGLPDLRESIRGGVNKTPGSPGGGGGNNTDSGGGGGEGGGSGARPFGAGGGALPDASRNLPTTPRNQRTGSSTPKPGQQGSFVAGTKRRRNPSVSGRLQGI